MYFLGLATRFHSRLGISPGSLSILTLFSGQAHVKAISDTGHLSD
jgi:hypothetical protein